jgi:Nucleotidyltransferase domain
VAGKRKVHRIAVFGSVARGEARPDSDLDLLVDFEPGTSLLDMSACSRTSRNCWASRSMSSHGARSSHETSTSALKKWICDQRSR